MIDNLLLALKVSGVGIVVLLAVLAAFAGLVSLMTRFLKDKPEEEEESGGEEEETVAAEAEAAPEAENLGQVAAIAVALARAQSVFTAAAQPSKGEFNSWGQYHLNRRLNSSVSFRRTK